MGGAMRSCLGALGLLWAVLAISPLRPADARSREERNQVREAREASRLRSEGEAALSRKDFAAATRAYTELYRRTLQLEGLYRLGTLAIAEGRVLDAQDLMRRFVSDSRFDPADNAGEAAEAQRILALPRPAGSKVSVIGERGTLVFVDGRLVGSLPLSRPLLCAPGKRTLVLENGRSRQEEEIELASGRSVEVTYDRSSVALLSAELPAVLVLEQYGETTQPVAPVLAQPIEDVLLGDRLSPFPLALALERAGLTRSGSCAENLDCQLRLARQSELDYVLNLHLSQPALGVGLPWQLRLVLLDAEVGEEAARSEQECDACDAAKAAALLRSSLSRLLAAARARSRGELKVTSTPAGAEVRVGTRLLGKTPFARTVWAGRLEVEVTLPGYEPARLPVTVPSGDKAAVVATLQPELAEPPPAALIIAPAPTLRLPQRRPRWRLVLGGVAAAGSALLFGFGASALAVADQCVVDPIPPAELCRQRLGTAPIGTGLVISGAAVLATGILLLSIPDRRAQTAGPKSARRSDAAALRLPALDMSRLAEESLRSRSQGLFAAAASDGN